MANHTVSVFPGQGAQVLRMGAGLFAKHEYHTRLANRVLGYSIEQLCNGEYGDLNATQYTQPALYVVNILHYLEHLEGGNPSPDLLAGHSLGEYCALYAAGVMSFQTGLKIVQERGRLMASCRGGTMAAILGLSCQNVKDILKHSQLKSVAVSNINSESQIVISGDAIEVSQLEQVFTAKGASFTPLNVSGAFHSASMVDIAAQLERFIASQELFSPKIPVLSNVTADYYPTNNPKVLLELLVKQLYSPVDWLACMTKISAFENVVLSEHGPKSVLTKLYGRLSNNNYEQMDEAS